MILSTADGANIACCCSSKSNFGRVGNDILGVTRGYGGACAFGTIGGTNIRDSISSNIIIVVSGDIPASIAMATTYNRRGITSNSLMERSIAFALDSSTSSNIGCRCSLGKNR